MTTQRLNKYLALQLGISRREADNLIARNVVKVNDVVAILGTRVNDGDKVSVNGKDLVGETPYEYVALNKPRSYVCSRKQQGDTPTIYDLLPKSFHRLKPVGRLDGDSSGIILLSNDGDFAYSMTHPKFAKTKIYSVGLDKDLEPLHQQMISDHGINLDDGSSKLQLERMNDTDRKNWTVYMHEGRNRQIRRTFAALGYTVLKLHRTNFGNYSIGDMKPGEYKAVSKL